MLGCFTCSALLNVSAPPPFAACRLAHPRCSSLRKRLFSGESVYIAVYGVLQASLILEYLQICFLWSDRDCAGVVGHSSGLRGYRYLCRLFIPLLLSVLLGMPRLLYRAWKDYQLIHPVDSSERVLILGAGRTAEALVRDMRRTGAFVPVGFIDDAVYLRGAKIQGLNVLGRLKKSATIARETAAKLLVIAILSLDALPACSVWWRCVKVLACRSGWYPS